MKKALVLAGGGTRGAYEAGVIKALHEMKKDTFDLVVGVSVGALNGAMIVQNEYEKLYDMYENLTADQIIDGLIPTDISLSTIVNDRAEVVKNVKNYLHEKGVDISPFVSKVDNMFDPRKFFASPVEFGCMVATHRSHEGVYVTKDMMKENGADWLVASASAYPAFPVKKIDGKEYIDGGYFDNLPIDFALRLGADNVLAVDLNCNPQHPNYLTRQNIRYLFPKVDTGSFLDFSHETMMRLMRLGYLDAYKAYGRYMGYKYTFEIYKKPDFFRKWYIDVELLETKIRLASNLNDRFRSSQVITDKLIERMHLPYLTDKNYFEGMMDVLMDLCGCNSEKVYTLEEARNSIVYAFADTVKEDFVWKPSINPVELASQVKNLDQKEIVSLLIHRNLYPSHSMFSENVILTMYPFEQALADFVYHWMIQLGEQEQ